MPSPTDTGRHDKGTEFMLRRYAFPMILLTATAVLAGCSPKGTTAETANVSDPSLGNGDASLTENDTAINDTLAADEGNSDIGGNDLDLNAATPR